MKHIKPISINEVRSTGTYSSMDILVSDIIEELNPQIRSLNRKALKKTTLALILNDLVPVLLQDGDSFDDIDRKTFKMNKEKVLKMVLNKI